MLSSAITITISILDENDNNPVFSFSTYRQTIAENSIQGSMVITLTATDEDSTSNGQLMYSLLEDRDVFEVDNTSGIVTVLEPSFLDYEVTQSFSFLVEARDMGVPTRATQALVGKRLCICSC